MFRHRHGERHFITAKFHKPQIKQNGAPRPWLRIGNGEQIPRKAIGGKVFRECVLVTIHVRML